MAMMVVACAALRIFAGQSQTVNLLGLSLEELGEVQVTSVSRKSESLSSAAAAVHVITADDIRRTGVTVLAEALRMVPGLEVARANSRQWAISARGFNAVFANKLLVLMDGRTLYTPLFSGVFWEETDTVLEDIDRIEVIRGPGATLWGANAVNGVINIITKSAKQTQGTLISGGGGIEERGFGTVRYGGRMGTNVFYRVYAKHSNHDEFTNVDGTGANDSWRITQGGFRLDWDTSEPNHLTLQGDYYYADLASAITRRVPDTPILFPEPFRSETRGANLIARWTRDLEAESEVSVQMYYDRTDRGFRIGREIRDTFDLDTQHRFHIGDRNEVVWGAGYRFSADDITESADFTMLDPSVGLQLASVFVQDEISLARDRLHLTVGTKVEHNDFTGFEVQPSVRVAWIPFQRHTVWSSISRAVRTPSRGERGFGIFVDPTPFLPTAPFPILAPGLGNPEFGSEKLIAYELGHRFDVTPNLSLDSAAFYNEYDDVASVAALPADLGISSSPLATPYLIIPLTFRNNLFGESYGTEVSVTWQPAEAWRLKLGYSFLKMNLHTKGVVRSLTEDAEIGSPEQQVFLWSDAKLGRKLEWGAGLRYVDRIRSQEIPGYAELDTRLAWKPSQSCELAIIGRNLLDGHHLEAEPLIIAPRNVEVDRSVYVKMTLSF